MPLIQGTSNDAVSKNIKELRKGGTYARTARRYGNEKANMQAIAIALKESQK